MPEYGHRTACVVIAETNFHYDRIFEYALPEGVFAVPGCRVLVPFGIGNRKRIGLILRFTDKSPHICDNPTSGEREPAVHDTAPQSLREPIVKPISEVIDEFPVVSEEGIKIIEWLVRTTFCTYFDACKLFLPAGMSVKLNTRFAVNEEVFESRKALLSDSDLSLIDQIRSFGKVKNSAKNSAHNSDNDTVSADLKALVAQDLIYPEEYLTKPGGKKTENIVSLTEEYASGSLKYAFTGDKPRRTVEFLKNSPPVSDKELIKLFGISAASLKTLQKRHIIDIYPTAITDTRTKTSDMNSDINSDYDSDEYSDDCVYDPFADPTNFTYTLSPAQTRAANGIKALMRDGKPSASLLFGVTGSGKTLVFTELIRHTLAMGKNAVLLVPEIALTPQLVRRFTETFGDAVACLHSGLSVTKRASEQARIRAGRVRLVIGTRSAVFAPLEHIGIIIIDEEQEQSFNSEQSPRYDTKEVAKFRCVYHNAALVLASATPSVESYYYAKTGRYHLFTMPERYADAALPDVSVIDIAADGYYGDSENFTCTLTEEITRTLERREQIILLLNRRGFNTVVTCRTCKQTVMCPHCSVALTYHRVENRLRCHWCGFAAQAVDACPNCKSPYLKFIGSGTQKIENEAEKLFPKARILRMDADTITSRNAYEEKFAAFERGEYDLLLGTQMIAKGLDFPNVTLVGVISADSALYAGDYRSYERTFSLLTQVSGRSGRSGKPGKAIIQTFMPEHYILNIAAVSDYPAFFAEEIGNRKLLLYPPFCDILTIELTGTDDTKTAASGKHFAESFRTAAEKLQNSEHKKIPLQILGPAKCRRERINNKYRHKLLIKCRFNADIQTILSSVYDTTFTDRVYSGITVTVSRNGDTGL
jgi:primosomal protein N' (replication factor Y)